MSTRTKAAPRRPLNIPPMLAKLGSGGLGKSPPPLPPPVPVGGFGLSPPPGFPVGGLGKSTFGLGKSVFGAGALGAGVGLGPPP